MQEIKQLSHKEQLKAALKETTDLWMSGLSPDEIAQRLNLPPSTIKNRIAVAKRILAETEE